jgi:hypothetical protein
MNTTTHNTPLGFWLAVVEHRTHDALRSAFADQAVSRREWRLLNVIGNGPVTLEELADAMPPRRGHKHPQRSARAERPETRRRRPTSEVVDAMIEKGWIVADDGRLTVTEEGSRARDDLQERVSAVRSKTGAGISEADYATTIATLEVMARNLGWTTREA